MKLQLEAKREEQLSEPFFKWGGGRASHASANNPLVVYRAFIIEGGAVTELTIKADGDIQSEISPKSHLGTHGTGEVKFSKIGVNFIGNVTFEIHYTTRLNKRSQKSFFWPANGEPTEIKD